MEDWKDIPGYEGLYQISTLGRVKRNERILRPGKSRGYFTLLLCKERNYRRFYIHRLLALAFIPNPENKPEVDHINRVRDDNRLENLRWATKSEQQINTNRVNDATNQRNIRKHGLRWRVQIERDNQMVFSQSYATLDEAKEARDAFLL